MLSQWCYCGVLMCHCGGSVVTLSLRCHCCQGDGNFYQCGGVVTAVGNVVTLVSVVVLCLELWALAKVTVVASVVTVVVVWW